MDDGSYEDAMDASSQEDEAEAEGASVEVYNEPVTSEPVMHSSAFAFLETPGHSTSAANPQDADMDRT